jgi:hypothetical protein
MVDYRKLNESLDKALLEEKKRSFDLGIPWVYGDKSGKLLIEEYKNGAKKVFKKDGDNLILIEIIPGKAGLS